MIRYLERANIDVKKWDACVDTSVNGKVYANAWYLDLVSPQWSALVEGDYEAVFPLTSRKKYGIRYLYQPFFTQQLGLFAKERTDDAVVEKFLSVVPGFFRFIEIQLNEANRIRGNDFKISERLTHHLDLGRPYDNIRKNYSENLKRNLKRAAQHALVPKADFGTRDLITLFRSNRGKEVQALAERDYDILEKLIDEGSRRNLISKIGIKTENNLEAGAVFIRSQHEFIFLFSATGEKAKESGAMAFIIDHFIMTHAPAAMQLDFEGSMDPGLARFYKSFGSNEIVYLQIKKNNLPLPLRWLKH